MEIKEINIEGERLFVKKSKIFGWAFVKPIKIDGKYNWKNILIGGSWIKFGIMLFVLLIIYGLANEYSVAVNLASECLEKSSQLIIIP